MTEKEQVIPSKARIKSGAFIGCDMHYCNWEDKGEIFTIEPFMDGRVKAVSDGYGSKRVYGNGAIYVKVDDLIPVASPIPENVRDDIWKVLLHLVVRDDDAINADEAIDQILSLIAPLIEQAREEGIERIIKELNIFNEELDTSTLGDKEFRKTVTGNWMTILSELKEEDGS